MLKIDSNNNIKLTRGDTMTLTVNLTRNGQEYTPLEDDVIKFSMARGYKGQAIYTQYASVVIPNDTLTFTLPAEQTQLKYDDYNYDVEITHSDGTVDTVISARLTITGEVG